MSVYVKKKLGEGQSNMNFNNFVKLRSQFCAQLLLYTSTFLCLYHWSEDDALRPRNAATLKARHMLVVLKVTYCSYLRYCQFT